MEEPRPGAVDKLIDDDGIDGLAVAGNALERAVAMTPGDVIGREVLPLRVIERQPMPLVSAQVPANPPLEVIERAYIEWVLRAEGGNKTRAAEILGIDPSTLYRKLARFEAGE